MIRFTGLMALAACLTLSLAAGSKAGAGKADAAKGKESFESQCAMCHNVDSNDSPKMGPTLKGLFKRKTLKNGKPVTEANVLAQINQGGGGMPPYDALEPDDKANIVAYLHTL